MQIEITNEVADDIDNLMSDLTHKRRFELVLSRVLDLEITFGSQIILGTATRCSTNLQSL